MVGRARRERPANLRRRSAKRAVAVARTSQEHEQRGLQRAEAADARAQLEEEHLEQRRQPWRPAPLGGPAAGNRQQQPR
eukprot:8562517-Pyramimonas_sp.AAC.1